MLWRASERRAVFFDDADRERTVAAVGLW